MAAAAGPTSAPDDVSAPASAEEILARGRIGVPRSAWITLGMAALMVTAGLKFALIDFEPLVALYPFGGGAAFVSWSIFGWLRGGGFLLTTSRLSWWLRYGGPRTVPLVDVAGVWLAGEARQGTLHLVIELRGGGRARLHRLERAEELCAAIQRAGVTAGRSPPSRS